jgi:hypothetical protein
MAKSSSELIIPSSRKDKLWRLWAKALGPKASNCPKEADAIAVFRFLIFTTYFVTNIFIVAGVIRHWNDNTPPTIQDKSIRYKP